MEVIEEMEQVEISSMDELDYEDTTRFMLELCELAGSKFDEERWENAFTRRITNPERYGGFIARRGDKPLGMLFAEAKGEIGYITNLYVVPEERHTEIVGPMRVPKRGQPLAERMVGTAFNFLRKHGCKEVLINMRKGVKPAEITYSRLGLEEKFTVLSKKL
ncbi:MAG: hypothetical protein WED07_15185 [Candidatus Freyarchaeum deiterrae]